MRVLINFYALLVLGLVPYLTIGQSLVTAPKIPDCSIARIKPKPSKAKPISVGVINGIALRLVKPDYPSSALAMNARGRVLITILIDEAGCVVETTAVSGHPLLIPASLKAAKASVFEPVILDGNPIRVYGIIIYNYSTNSMNWLELGFISDSFETLSEHLPAGFDVESKLLRQSKDLPWEEKEKVLDSVQKSLASDLVSDPKDQWLFLVGSQLKALRTGAWGGQSVEKACSSLRSQMASIPTDVSPRLKAMINELLSLTDSSEFDQKLGDIEDRLFDLGN